MEEKIFHTLQPIYDENSEILILGSLPSVISREKNFYYAHPKNRFWKVISKVYKEKEPETIEEKKDFLIQNKIALYDVIKSCQINGSKDSSIKNVEVNDIQSIIKKTKIKKIYTTGRKSYNLYNKYLKDKVQIEAIYLPSTSPANANIPEEELIKYYQILKEK